LLFRNLEESDPGKGNEIQSLIDIVLLAGFIAKLSVEQHSFAQESTKLAKGFRRKQVNI